MSDENFFGNHPNGHDNDMSSYSDNWGIDSKHEMKSGSIHKESSDVKEHFLCAAAHRRTQESDWLSDLASCYESHDKTNNKFFDDIIIQDQMIFWVNRLFKCLQHLVDLFNTKVQRVNMQVNAEPPDFHTLIDKDGWQFENSGKTIIYEGHLASRQNALLIRGKGDTVYAFVVPSDIWLGLSANELDERDYPPFAVMKVSANYLTVWIDEMQTFSVDMCSVAQLAILLFIKLLEPTSTEQNLDAVSIRFG